MFWGFSYFISQPILLQLYQHGILVHRLQITRSQLSADIRSAVYHHFYQLLNTHHLKQPKNVFLCYYVFIFCSSVSRHLRVFLKIGFTLLEERLAAFLRFVQEVIKHRGIAGQLLNASLPVQLGVQS